MNQLLKVYKGVLVVTYTLYITVLETLVGKIAGYAYLNRTRFVLLRKS